MKNQKANSRIREEEWIFRKRFTQLTEDPRIRLLKNYPQHKCCDSFTHSRNVTLCAWFLAKKLPCRIDVEALVVGALLHDYYLYDIEKSGLTAYQHGTRHPRTALKNAEKKFRLTEKEKNIILSHMWPLPFTAMPRSREALLVGLADKICAVREICFGMTEMKALLFFL